MEDYTALESELQQLSEEREVSLKYCARCETSKPLDQFFKAKKGKHLKSGYCKPCCKAYKIEKYAGKIYEYERQKRQNLKKQFLEAYGGKCECCGESEPDFLTVDHINNDGEQHRKSLNPRVRRGGSTDYVLRSLRKEGWPSYVRILCFNCNFGRRGKSECPHKRTTIALVGA